VELRAYAHAILTADDLAGKLRPPPPALSDHAPGPSLRLAAPVRPRELAIAGPRAVKVPPIAGMRDPGQRARILHAMANHELQAAELFAWALLAFPAAPPGFRRGLVAILDDEQRHCELYLARLAAHGVRFGDYPLTAHFWHRVDRLDTPLAFVCTMSLTFESANLDFAQEYAAAARDAGDPDTAAVLERVHSDEIRHVRFGWHWLDKWKPAGASAWRAYTAAVPPPLGPERARGKRFDAESRRAAGLDDEFVDGLAAARALRPNGLPR
jgi:uncharacterized ferritin-like protein (DUF455 family)